MTSERDKKAFLVAIPVASFLAACSFASFGIWGKDRFVSQTDMLEIAQIVIAYSVFMLPFVAFGGVLVGLPIAMLFRRLSITYAGAWLIAGAMAGGAVSFAILGSLAVNLTADVAVWAISIGVVPGFAAALIWWRITERFQATDFSHA